MKKSLPVLLMLSAFSTLPAHADERANAFAITLDPLLADTERPSGGRSEKHQPRFGIEYARTVWSRLDLTLGAGVHQLRVRSGDETDTRGMLDIRAGFRQYFTSREVGSWSPFLAGSISEAWLRDADSDVGGNRRYTGWSASVGVAKLLSENTDIRFSLGYTRLQARDKLGTHLDVLSSADLGLAAAMRF